MVSLGAASYLSNLAFANGLTLFVVFMHTMMLFVIAPRLIAVVLSTLFLLVPIALMDINDALVLRGILSAGMASLLFGVWLSVLNQTGSEATTPPQLRRKALFISLCVTATALLVVIFPLIVSGQTVEMTQGMYKILIGELIVAALLFYVVYEFSLAFMRKQSLLVENELKLSSLC